MKRQVETILLLGVLICSVWIWGGGCDFSHVEEVDEGSTKAATILAALSTADTQTKAEAVITSLLNELETSSSPYAGYVLTDEDISALAQAHVQFLKQQLNPTPTLGSTYAKVASAGHTIVMEMSEVLAVLEEFANYALAEPDEPSNLLLIVVVTAGSEVPDFSSEQHPGRVISPVQDFLFETWLHRHGPSMDVYVSKKRGSKPSGSCPEASNTCPNAPRNRAVCHKPGTPAEKTLCLPPSAVPGHLGHGDRCGVCHDQGGGN